MNPPPPFHGCVGAGILSVGEGGNIDEDGVDSEDGFGEAAAYWSLDERGTGRGVVGRPAAIGPAPWKR